MAYISDAEFREYQNLRREKLESGNRINELRQMTQRILEVPRQNRPAYINQTLISQFPSTTISLLLNLIGLPFSDSALRTSILSILIPVSGIQFCLEFIGDLIVSIKRIVTSILQGVYDAFVWVSKKVYQGICYMGNKIYQGAFWFGSKIKSLWNWIFN